AGGDGDVWQWGAPPGGMSGWVDHAHFGPPLPGAAPPPSGRHAGGLPIKPQRLPHPNNFPHRSSPRAYPRVRPVRFPKNAAAFLKLSWLSLDPDNSAAETSRFWLSPDESEPYSEVIDRAVPAGTVIPSILFSPEMAKREDPESVIGNARW